jgi:hypothetical protein
VRVQPTRSCNRFNGFLAFRIETVETVFQSEILLNTGLKPGVNERAFEAKLTSALNDAFDNFWIFPSRA